MKTEKVKLKRVKINKENPRTITGSKFAKLVNSILVFPRMLEIRPVVVDSTYTALGGNMRTNALQAIAKMSIGEVQERLEGCQEYAELSQGEQEQRVAFWKEWLQEPVVEVIYADNLTEDEKQQFIIKDNTSFGAWDYDALANKWDARKLEDWGMDVWNTEDLPGSEEEEEDQEEETPEDFSDALPEELQGLDLTPGDLPKIEGRDETPRSYVVISYTESQRGDLARVLGVSREKLSKVVYSLDELIDLREE